MVQGERYELLETMLFCVLYLPGEKRKNTVLERERDYSNIQDLPPDTRFSRAYKNYKLVSA